MKSKQSLFAFWRYDTYPFLIGAKIEQFKALGQVVPEGWQGRSFRPAFIVTEIEGIGLKQELKKLEDERKTALRELDKKYEEKANKLLESYGYKVKQS